MYKQIRVAAILRLCPVLRVQPRSRLQVLETIHLFGHICTLHPKTRPIITHGGGMTITLAERDTAYGSRLHKSFLKL